MKPRSHGECVDVDSLDALLDEIKRMGDPAPGDARVFRGQTREYLDREGQPMLLPSLSRRSGAPMYDPAWLGMMMAAAMPGNRSGYDFETMQVWSPALVQHYGPGSHFLDVTHDLDTALWFCSHRYHERWILLEAGKNAFQYAVAWSSDVPAVRDPAASPAVYVFDVKPWNGVARPAHGELVDLRELEPDGRLVALAARLRAQSGALLFANPAAEGGPDLRPKVSLRLRLGPQFDIATIADRKWVGDIYPDPADDPFYRALLAFPAYMRFDPPRMEQPLAIPFQLTRALPVQGSPNVKVLGGTGEYGAPYRVMLASKGPDRHVVSQIQDYVNLGSRMKPPLVHAFLLESGEPDVELNGERFALADALALFPETPLWRFTPGATSANERRAWLECALPLGIADRIEGRSTSSVYMEMSPLDIMTPGEPADEEMLRAVWVVRQGNDYVVRQFRKAADVYTVTLRHRYNETTGSFELVDAIDAKGDANIAGLVASSLKLLFLTRTVLRDLSPGYKPPPTYSLRIDDTLIPYPLLEPQLALPRVVTQPYIVPKALDGSRYLRASGGPRETRNVPDDPAEAHRELERYFPLVTAPAWRAFAAAELARLSALLGHGAQAIEMVGVAEALARSERIPQLQEQVAQFKQTLPAFMFRRS